MKNRILSCILVSFMVGVMLTLFQEAYLASHIDIVYGVTSKLYGYLFVYAMITALLYEIWCYMLPYIEVYEPIVYGVLLLSNFMVWNLPIYVSVFFGLYYAYISILFAYQFGCYKLANKQLRNFLEK